MGNSVFCSITNEADNNEGFELIKGKNGNNFDLEKSIKPMPAQILSIKAQGYRDVLAIAYIDETFKHEDKHKAFAKVLKLSRLQYDCADVAEAADKLLNIWIDEIRLSYDDSDQLRQGGNANKFTPAYMDANFVFPETFAEVMEQAEEVYKASVETGHIYESSWRLDNFGCSWIPRFGESEAGYIKFETVTSAPIEGFKLFAKTVKLTGDAEYFEENEGFWGVMVFKGGELVEHRENNPKDFEDFFGSDEDGFDD